MAKILVLHQFCVQPFVHCILMLCVCVQDHSKTSKKKKGKKGSGVNLKNSPFLLKDGDIIGVKVS